MTKFYHSQKKRYGCIFTCMSTRAIHIEMLYSLDAQSLSCAFKRFVAHRGGVTKILSDNATNFTKGEQELCQAFLFHSRNTLYQYAVPNSIEWSFIPPKFPNFGGFYERLIAVLKRVFRAILPKASHLTDGTLSTVF